MPMIETRRVVVPLYRDWPAAAPFRLPEDADKSCVYREIEVPWVCIKCGAPREEPRWRDPHHVWYQPCGCFSAYTDAMKQAKAHLDQQPKSDRSGQLRLF